MEARPRDLRDVARLVERPLAPSPSGHLAYVGEDDNVYVVDPLTGSTVQVTNDRSSAGTGYGIFHTGMAWSRTGELAFARSDTDSFTSTLFVTVPGSGKAMRVTRKRGILIYASWSPGRCHAPACRHLATITDVDREPGGNVALSVLAFPTPSSARSLLEKRAPQIYFSWAGRDDRLIRHTIGVRPGLDEIDLRSGTSRTVAKRLGPFLAPAFVRGRPVYAVADEGGNEAIVTRTTSTVIVHAPRDARRVAFAPSPDGTRLAFAVRRRPEVTPPQAFEEPWIVDLETGELVQVGPATLSTKAFYWSPDGNRLAYLTWLDNDYRQYNQWRIFDTEARKDHGSVAFEPTSTFDTLTTFFDQFGQSHSFWSPDSRYLAYGAVSPDGEEQVWLLDTKGREDQTLVADGVVGAFSRR